MSESNLIPLDPDKGSWDEKELSRRQFLQTTFWAVTGVTVVAVGGAGSRFLVGNSLEPRESKWVLVGKVSDLPAGAVHRVNYTMRAKDAWREVEKKGALYAFSDDGTTYTVLDAICTHLGCIVQWQPGENIYSCPCHSAIFTREGEVTSGPPPKPLNRLETKVEAEQLWAQI